MKARSIDVRRAPASWVGLVISTALGPVIGAPAAYAQDSSTGDSSVLTEIVVTATRQSSTVNRVPLSISAFNQEVLEQQGVQNIDDLRRMTPGLGLSFGNNSATASTSGDTNISLRGIASQTGAATTGVYLDDVPIHKTSSQGNGFGAPYPKLFDIDRVEVLRGPQGTLYGGSTQGGAVRFITPAPSLTEYSGSLRTEGSAVKDGDPSYEAGFAWGGPLVADKLGLRVSAWGRRDGGYIDYVSRFTGDTIEENVNSIDAFMGRASLRWAPNDNADVTLALFWQEEKRHDTDQFWENSPAVDAPAIGINANGRNCNAVPVTNCARVIPAHTYGPYDMFGPYRNGATIYDEATGTEYVRKSPRDESLFVPSLVIDYDFGNVVFKSITGYTLDKVEGGNNTGYKGGAPFSFNTYPANELYINPGDWSFTYYTNDHESVSQEFRLSSRPDAGRLTWVAGLYFSSNKLEYNQVSTGNLVEAFPAVRGVTYEQYYGYPPLSDAPGARPGATRDASTILEETSMAVFGEASYEVTDKLKLTAGLRLSETEVKFKSIGKGQSHPTGAFEATVENGGIVTGQTKESPVTPKLGVTYQLTDYNLVYATAAKGFRSGGFNTPAQSQSPVCQDTLAALNLPDIPRTFDSDSVISYEAGAKLRLLGGRAQLNSSVYHIDWEDIQTLLSIPNCGQHTANAAVAVSRGFDVQGQLRLLGAWTLSATVGYTDAKFTEDVRTPTTSGGFTSVINKDDRIAGVPEWSYTVGLQYDFTVGSDLDAYIRGDYQFADGVYRSTGPGTNGYQPDIYESDSIEFASMRAGLALNDRLDIALFAKNVFNSQDRTFLLGGSNSTRTSPNLFGQTFRPREVGLNLTYRY